MLAGGDRQDVWVLRVPRTETEAARRALRAARWLDPGHPIRVEGEWAYLPLGNRPDSTSFPPSWELVEDEGWDPRPPPFHPYEEIRRRLADLPPEVRDRLPRRWERLGDVLVFKGLPGRGAVRDRVAATYAAVLKAKTVVLDVGGIRGPWRTPDVERVWGDGTETVHAENGVRYALDVARVMFASGNMAERRRMAEAVEPGEVVADLFAGIGYFALPMAVHGRPRRVVACEVNPLAFRYLEQNVRLNRAFAVEPRLGDCRDTAPVAEADRVVMGYLDAHAYLDVALRALGAEGVVHYHETCPRALWPERPVRRLERAARAAGRTLSVLGMRVVKSYAPGVSHVVVDGAVR
jgi:tRNA wybutosine-synthesizing protein 2